MKICKTCQRSLHTSKFNVHHSNRDRLRSNCKDCQRITDSERYKKTKDQRKITSGRWYQQNKESVLSRSREWQTNNPEKIRAKRWRRRTKSNSVFSDHQPFSQKFIRELYLECLCCGTTLDLTIDHVLPLSLGGTNTLGNYQVLCRSCNSSKGTKVIDYRRGRHASTDI